MFDTCLPLPTPLLTLIVIFSHGLEGDPFRFIIPVLAVGSVSQPTLSPSFYFSICYHGCREELQAEEIPGQEDEAESSYASVVQTQDW